jgi:hypothetical protein
MRTLNPVGLRLKYAIGLALALLVLGSPSVVRADTFDFSFATLSGDFSGSGSFETYPFATAPGTDEPIAYSGFYISSLAGDVDGIPMVLVPGSAMDYYGPLPPIPGIPLTTFTEYNFLNGSLEFTLGGQLYFIHDLDEGPASTMGLNLVGPGGGPITMTVVPASEPSTFLSLAFGLFFVFVLAWKYAGGAFRGFDAQMVRPIRNRFRFLTNRAGLV